MKSRADNSENSEQSVASCLYTDISLGLTMVIADSTLCIMLSEGAFRLLKQFSSSKVSSAAFCVSFAAFVKRKLKEEGGELRRFVHAPF